ncbi:hypothetical protein SUGI_0215230 [Cryptomeria japonica]|uniref:phosphatidate cytidylyltransferase 4, chloroplastic n=1 Tax=Cryptomeria japonica TaxID=3369 RepID=UPI002408DA7E|nr:phosphatidate cytidylyltransferase 4, chloroplastic [Cryptomeria japonica]XP_057855235.2 phosphatidate cytidylyltransferase 4, chloroplastic [Cryptomeria japonica]XP_057855236.2 phosphatidate cytidylyltransferase 4, chloroplastic [Cryptomeria japonica]XP_057855237.2 phosphatidate cytidylyltransferase 4, chloroplastic [Cryptomeria japonica]XP_057855238.2 phosphatidate cytidylyltransferase 4, chloroplastic [Cryptomeria japonica]XP_057855239.2 phosphatidate cytidylyltransferase 4, chloroplasti
METCQYSSSPISILLLPKSSTVQQASLAFRNFGSSSSVRTHLSVNRRQCFRLFCQPQIALFLKFKLRVDNRLHFSPLLGGPGTTCALERRRLYRETANRQFSCNAVGADAEQCKEEDSQEDAQGNGQIKVDTEAENAQNHELERQNQSRQLQKRIIFGLAIGVSVGAFVLAGGWIFTVGLALAILVGTREYFELVRSHGIAAGMTPPPRYVSRVCSAICAVMPLMTMYFGGRMGVAVTSSAFFLAIVLFLQRESPRFAQLSSIIFGLFYCGYLPSFWVKLRCGLAVPALNTKIGALWPVLLGGQAQWTVGLVATLMSISSIIAADTGAFLGGKTFGRTPLTSVSPKKTWEGAFAGFGTSLAVTIVLFKILSWPTSFLSAFAFALLNFMGSIFGDLIESMIKRDAGVKDSGRLIPGHGGLLDRVDSYLFTGALVYSFVKIGLPLYGV